MPRSWRSRLHYWSRQNSALKRIAVSIVLAGFLTAWMYVQVRERTAGKGRMDPVAFEVREAWQQLQRAPSPRPRELSRWLRDLLPVMNHLCEAGELEYPTWKSYAANGHLADYDVRALIHRHAGDAATEALLSDFVEIQLTEKATATEAESRLRRAAGLAPPPALANELLGAALLRREDAEGALAADLKEIEAFPDARPLRKVALGLALDLENSDVIRWISRQPGWLEEMPAWMVSEVGWQLHDPWLIGRGMIRYRLENLPLGEVVQAAVAAGLWYLILVLQSSPWRWRWVFPLLPFAAGALSTWPTLSLGAWQETALNLSEKAPFPYDLWYWVAGVGLREELSKLALFALFLPWLLKRRQPGLALMTGAFVGLGFAFDENIDYYHDFGGAVSVVRFLTANFLHLAWTGITAHALYELVRSRFATAERFIVTFFAIVAAHGLYDYTPSSGEMDGMSYIQLLLLVLAAHQFLEAAARECVPSRQVIAPPAVFLVGTAALVAMAFWVSAVKHHSTAGLAAVGMEAVLTLPLGVVYWRRLG